MFSHIPQLVCDTILSWHHTSCGPFVRAFRPVTDHVIHQRLSPGSNRDRRVTDTIFTHRLEFPFAQKKAQDKPHDIYNLLYSKFGKEWIKTKWDIQSGRKEGPDEVWCHVSIEKNTKFASASLLFGHLKFMLQSNWGCNTPAALMIRVVNKWAS